MLWTEFIEQYSGGDEALFDAAFIERWGGDEWKRG